VEKMNFCLVGGAGFIGRHLSRELSQAGHNVTVVDISLPADSQLAFVELSILDANGVLRHFQSVEYDVIINLAAITEDKSSDIATYKVNYIGTFNLLQALIRTNFIGKFFHISSQYAAAPKKNERSSDPEIAINRYGDSKLVSEHLVKSSTIPHWCIFRPTNIWGPNHPGFPEGFWKTLATGNYVHPLRKVVRSYGSVFTVSRQIRFLSEAKPATTHGQTLYLGNDPVDSYLWVNRFSLEIANRTVRRVPTVALFGIAVIATILNRLRPDSVPFSWKRFRSMTTDYIVDMKPTWEILGEDHFDFEADIEKTAHWYLNDYKRP
jgi:nucleoside-diphosphate-sugar epimerase